MEDLVAVTFSDNHYVKVFYIFRKIRLPHAVFYIFSAFSAILWIHTPFLTSQNPMTHLIRSVS